MRYTNDSHSTICKSHYRNLLLVTLLLAAVTSAFSQGNGKSATIDATAMGTSTQLGKVVNVKVIINRFSTEEERQTLIAAFKKGQNPGLVDALSKMEPAGRIAITGTVGYDLSYIRLIPTPTGRKIRFVTNRLIRFGEAYNNTRSMAYNLTVGEFDIVDADTDKSSGVLYPASQLIINKDGQLEFQLNQNPWKLVNLIDWHKAGTAK